MSKPLQTDPAETGRTSGANAQALLLGALFDDAAQLMAVLSPDGRIVEVNRAATEVAGPAARSLVGMAFEDAPWWEDGADARARVRACIAKALAGEIASWDVELPEEHGGRIFDLSIRSIMDDAGTTVLLIAEGRDVTEARWAERALRVSEARFAGIIAIASDAIVSVDGNFEITLFNQGAEATFGYRAEEVLGQPLELLLPHRFRGNHAHHMHAFAGAAVAARRMGERQEISGLRRDGTEFPAEASISRLDLFGSPVFTVVLRDITDRKRIERSQRFLAQAGSILASSLDYETTLASVAGLTVPELADWCVVYIQDEDGSIRRLQVAHADPSRRDLLTQLMTYRLDRRSPHPAFTVVETGQPQIMHEVGDDFLDALSQSPQHRRIYDGLGLGSLMMVPLTARGVTRGAMGFFSAKPQRYGRDELALAQDLAVLSAMAVDNARLYRDARAAIGARDDLIAVVSHDLGNPLSAIRIGTSLLLKTVPQEELTSASWQHLEYIRQSAQQMENLINDLMDVKRLESGTVALSPRPVHAADLAAEVIDVFRPIAQNRSLVLECTVRAELPQISADPRRLVQVLSNLMANALKFTEPGGRVELSATESGDVVLFAVSDTGHGIPLEHQPHVFDRFWQARRDGKKGLGLGLAIARGIVDAHGGRIWLESTPETGTTFLFTIPVAR